MKGPELPIGIYLHAMINFDTKNTMIIGGLTVSYSNQTFVFNHDHYVWSWGPSLIQARFNHAVGIVTDEASQEKFVFVAGGINSNILNSTEILINQTFSYGKASSLIEAIQQLDFFSAQVDSFLYHEWLRVSSDQEINLQVLRKGLTLKLLQSEEELLIEAINTIHLLL